MGGDSEGGGFELNLRHGAKRGDWGGTVHKEEGGHMYRTSDQQNVLLDQSISRSLKAFHQRLQSSMRLCDSSQTDLGRYF